MGRSAQIKVDAGQRRVMPFERLAASDSSPPMVNALDAIRSDPLARRFEIGEILFAQFSCGPDSVGIWTQTDYLMHVISGTASWKAPTGAGSARAHETVFFKKGAYVLPEHFADDPCVQLYFIPDGFVRHIITQLAADIPQARAPVAATDRVIRVSSDIALSAFFDAMVVYFAADEDPPEALLKLKLQELLTGILLSRRNPALAAHFQSVAACDVPPLAAIMEANCHYNLPLLTYAQMCHRSLSSFKRDFRMHYGTSPGKWLLERRLQRSMSLLQMTRMSVTEIMLECGFEDLSHFSKAFKEKFGQPPSLCRGADYVKRPWTTAR